MTLSDVLLSEELCRYVCEYLDPEWRHHFANDEYLGAEYYIKHSPEAVRNALWEYEE